MRARDRVFTVMALLFASAGILGALLIKTTPGFDPSSCPDQSAICDPLPMNNYHLGLRLMVLGAGIVTAAVTLALKRRLGPGRPLA